ncbi:MAG: hypothetical protein ACREIS_05705 [Nitrospiraceae bacterium]
MRLRALGVEVRVPEPRFRANVEDRHEFSRNDVDIWAGDRAIEVKGRNLRFTGPTDFPMDPVFVDTVRGWRAKRRRPMAVVVASVMDTEEATGMLVIPASTEPRWVTRNERDQTRGITDAFLAANRSDCRTIEEFAEWLLATEERRRTAPSFCSPPICRRQDLVRLKAETESPLSPGVKQGETVAFRCRRCGLVYSPKDVVGNL